VSTSFFEAGTIDGQIDVEVTYQIIGLFSEGLYSSPYKALEELVSNSFDADASSVHVVVPPDLADRSASIAVIDNGVGMDAEGLRLHWIVGDSIKRRNRETATGRRTIGKFGIGKLAAYVLGDRLTHISRVGNEYFSTTMDFSVIPKTVSVGPRAAAKVHQPGRNGDVQLPLRKLKVNEAREALAIWLDNDGARKELQLFGRGASRSWTIAVISDLKPMAQEISPGMLRWLLGTAMPLRDDFRLYLNNQRVDSSKVKGKRVGSWTLGKNLKQLPKPGPSTLESAINGEVEPPAFAHWHVVDQLLGPVSGYLEVFENPLDTGKSELIGRSNGFFVYVNGRLVNPYDSGFGIDRNTLRHGTFSRFRFVVNMDRLDEELRSSRESLRDGPQLIRAREILQGGFNFARSKLAAHADAKRSGRQATQRLAESPASLSEKPILRMILDVFDGRAAGRYVTVPEARAFADADALRDHIEARIATGGGVVADVAYADLGVYRPIAVLDAVSGVLSINLEHPFVAHFADEFGDERRNLPLQLFAMAELLLEAHLYGSGADSDDVETVLDERDELLRHLARTSGAKNSLVIAQELLASATSKKELEDAVVAAFDQLGFEAVPRGGNDDSDGIAEAYLPAVDGEPQRYRVSLEAKSKETVGAKVTKKGVEVSTIARHRDENNCDHAIVVGPRFQTGSDDLGAVVREIKSDRENTGKTITLITIDDLARLVRVAPIKRISLSQLRDLFQTASTPAESAKWIDDQSARERPPAKYRDILETVWSEQEDDENYSVTYASLRTALRLRRQITIGEQDLRSDCLALARMAPDLFYAREDRVELNIKPEKVLLAIRDYVGEEKKAGS
jgi:hypothetical protein